MLRKNESQQQLKYINLIIIIIIIIVANHAQTIVHFVCFM